VGFLCIVVHGDTIDFYLRKEHDRFMDNGTVFAKILPSGSCLGRHCESGRMRNTPSITYNFIKSLVFRLEMMLLIPIFNVLGCPPRAAGLKLDALTESAKKKGIAN
jgi:hypothetical protein